MQSVGGWICTKLLWVKCLIWLYLSNGINPRGHAAGMGVRQVTAPGTVVLSVGFFFLLLFLLLFLFLRIWSGTCFAKGVMGWEIKKVDLCIISSDFVYLTPWMSCPYLRFLLFSVLTTPSRLST